MNLIIEKALGDDTGSSMEESNFLKVAFSMHLELEVGQFHLDLFNEFVHSLV